MDDSKIRCIGSGGLEAWGPAAWMVILQPAAWRLGAAGSLDANCKGEGGDDAVGE